MSMQVIPKMFEEGIRRVIKGLAYNDSTPMTMNELKGYLFGMAIVPYEFENDKFLETIFGGNLPKFSSLEQKELVLDIFLSALDYYTKAYLEDKLDFPFNYNTSNPDVKYFDKLKEWCNGFIQSVYFFPEFWLVDETLSFYNVFINNDDTFNLENLNYEQFIFVAVATSDMIANYEQYRNYLLENHIELTGINRDEYDEQQIEQSLKKELLTNFNTVYEVLLLHANKQLDEMSEDILSLDKNIKIGRNDPCPCGSGKKYKHCCGKNS